MTDIPQNFDPRLKTAMAEIREITTRYDIGAVVFLVSPTHSEYTCQPASWAVLQASPQDAKVLHTSVQVAASRLIQPYLGPPISPSSTTEDTYV